MTGMLGITHEVYVLDIGNYSAGGETLYQFANDLMNRGYKVSICYTKAAQVVKFPDKFKKYIRRVKRIPFESISDSENFTFIVPESATRHLFRFVKAKKIIMWMSFDNHDGFLHFDKLSPTYSSLKYKVNKVVRFILRCSYNFLRYGSARFPVTEALNIGCSFYACEQLKSHYGIDAFRLFDPIGIDFLEAGMYTNINHRNNIVLYNPAKASTIMEKLLSRSKFHYLPLKGLDFPGLLSAYRTSKVYVDFGAFPGPERIPKEAAYNGANILVGRRGAAVTNDVLIPNRFKLDLTETPIDKIEYKIGEMLKCYEKEFSEFDSFRNMINNMQNLYQSQLDRLFGEKLV